MCSRIARAVTSWRTYLACHAHGRARASVHWIDERERKIARERLHWVDEKKGYCRREEDYVHMHWVDCPRCQNLKVLFVHSARE